MDIRGFVLMSTKAKVTCVNEPSISLYYTKIPPRLRRPPTSNPCPTSPADRSLARLWFALLEQMWSQTTKGESSTVDGHAAAGKGPGEVGCCSRLSGLEKHSDRNMDALASCSILGGLCSSWGVISFVLASDFKTILYPSSAFSFISCNDFDDVHAEWWSWQSRQAVIAHRQRSKGHRVGEEGRGSCT